MKRPGDFSYPNPPNDIPASPLAAQAFTGFSLPWPRKPIGKPGKSSRPATTRSGVHRLGRPKRKAY